MSKELDLYHNITPQTTYISYYEKLKPNPIHFSRVKLVELRNHDSKRLRIGP